MNPDRDPNPAADSPNPSRRPPKAWRILWVLLLLLVFGTAMLLVGRSFGDRISATVAEMWNDLAGTDDAEHQPDDGDGGDGGLFTCGMHPWVILPAPGLCPICHMDLTPLDPSKFTGEIAIDPVVAQNIGVRVATVEPGPVVKTVRTVGEVDYDETRLYDVNLRVAGWIEKLHVDYLGAPVAAGEPLFELYSPELYTAQQEYLLALQQQSQPSVPFVPRVATDAASSLAAARRRLTYFGIDDAQIAALERAGEPHPTMTIRSPHQGVVIDKMAVDGMRVQPGMRMYRIADLDRVWVKAAIYEYQLPFVVVGQPAKMTLPYLAGEERTGKVTYIDPWTDEKTRQISVRLEFDNTDGKLKPGMFASVELRRQLADERPLVSRSAVIDTGERQVVIRSLGGGRFEPREVELGVETDGGMVEVRDGLSAGDEVVISAQFLLDSEARIREGILRMLRGGLAESGDEVAATELDTLPAALAAALVRALGAYLAIGDTMASDAMTGIADQAKKLHQAMQAATAVSIPGHEHFWHQHPEAGTVQQQAQALSATTELKAARAVFADLSTAFVKLLQATGVPPDFDGTIERLHCPMYQEDRGGAAWLQTGSEVRNPYYGSVMLACFDTRDAMPVAGQAGDVPDGAAVDTTAAVDALVEAYLRASATLLADRTDGLDELWHDLHQAAGQLGKGPDPIATLARAVAAAVPGKGLDIEAVRTAFKPLSEAMIALVRVAPASQPLSRAFCPMAEADWLQVGDKVQNPYMGQDMPECGRVEERLPARTTGGQGR
ncbi:MAG TPA: efflux RND transporter periplasmic adaptor subunit [bacterium]|nr:efflux RND transporter periplasmic adaptor subunit [bacterium]